MAFHSFLHEQMLPKLPKKWISHWVGLMAHLNGPSWVNQKLIKAFASYYGIDLDEAEKPIEQYRSLGEFFSRRLKPGARPVESPLIHPCDGVLVESGKIHDQILIQAKEKSYSLSELTPKNPWMENFNGGFFFTYYLAPHNYHRVHSPVRCKVKWSTHIPGDLWPVNGWSIKNVDGLYTVNERVVTGLECDQGQVILIMVGATNVGSISVGFDSGIKTNMEKGEVVHRTYKEGKNFESGQEFGIFHLGSTVIVLFDQSWSFSYKESQKVKMGENLLT